MGQRELRQAVCWRGVLRGAVIGLVLVAAGCNAYLHQRDQAAAAQKLSAAAHDALGEGDSVWDSMEANLAAFAPVERLAIEQAVNQGKATQRRLIYIWTWTELNEEAADGAEEAMKDLTEIKSGIAVTLAKIAKAEAVLATEKGKLEPRSQAPAGDKGPASRASGLIKLAKRELAHAKAKLIRVKIPDDLGEPVVTNGVAAAENLAAVADNIATAVDKLYRSAIQLNREGWPLDKALEVLRNAAHLELINGLVGGTTFKGSAEIADGYQRVMEFLYKDSTKEAVTSVQELRDLLAKNDVPIKLVQLRLRRDLATSRIESLEVDLVYLREKIKEYGTRAKLAKDRIGVAIIVTNFVTGKLSEIKVTTAQGHERMASADDGIFTLIRHLVDSIREWEQRIQLNDKPDKGTLAKKYNKQLAAATQALQAVAAYVSLTGDMAVQNELGKIGTARTEHRYSIRRSRVAARTWQRLLLGGADGLDAYWSGGVRPEDVAIVTLLVAQVAATSIGAGK